MAASTVGCIDTHTSAHLVWGSLRLIPIMLVAKSQTRHTSCMVCQACLLLVQFSDGFYTAALIDALAKTITPKVSVTAQPTG